jgi:hypothetical protein
MPGVQAGRSEAIPVTAPLGARLSGFLFGGKNSKIPQGKKGRRKE